MAYRRDYVIITPLAAGSWRAGRNPRTSRVSGAGSGGHVRRVHRIHRATRAGRKGRAGGVCAACGIATYRRVGRHRRGTPGTAPRSLVRRRAFHRRARHRRTVRPAVSTLRYSGVMGLVGALVASSWFAIAGAAAAAQMIHP